METSNTTSNFHFQYTSSSSSPSERPVHVVMSPCAACKIQRQRCATKCVLAPFFPPTEPHKFMVVHRVFGASNIIKLLQGVPESQRADAVASLVYEATARIQNPIFGCTGTICQLQKQVSELQAALARARAGLISIRTQQANLISIISNDSILQTADSPCFAEDSSQSLLLEPLWT